MSDTTLSKSAVALVAVGTTQTAGTVTSGTTTNQRQAGTEDLRTEQGCLLTMKITNGVTGPNAQCEGRVLIAHNDGATPSLPSVGTPVAGADWKTFWVFGGGTTANAITESGPIYLGPEIMHVAVEFTGNTGQNVTVEALLSKVNSAATA